MLTIDIIAEAASRGIPLNHWVNGLFERSPGGVIYIRNTDTSPHELGDTSATTTYYDLAIVEQDRVTLETLLSELPGLYWFVFQPTIDLEILDPWQADEQDLESIVDMVLDRAGSTEWAKAAKNYSITDLLKENYSFKYLKSVLVKAGYHGVYTNEPESRLRRFRILSPMWVKFMDSRNIWENDKTKTEVREWSKDRIRYLVREMERNPSQASAIFGGLPATARSHIVNQKIVKLSPVVCFEIYKRFPHVSLMNKLNDHEYITFLDLAIGNPHIVYPTLLKSVVTRKNFRPLLRHIFNLTEKPSLNVKFERIIVNVLNMKNLNFPKAEVLQLLTSFDGGLFLDKYKNWSKLFPSSFNEFKIPLIKGAIEYYKKYALTDTTEYTTLVNLAKEAAAQ